tara:strand:+ start:1446 stop:1622 length:177 start_codon:yes stop_codon:yes gene_type:complete
MSIGKEIEQLDDFKGLWKQMKRREKLVRELRKDLRRVRAERDRYKDELTQLKEYNPHG